MNVDTAKLRQFINEHFGPQDLNDLLFDYFRSVHDDVTPGMTKRQQISLLLEFCHRHNQMPNLLAAVAQMRPFFQPDDYVPGEKAPAAAPQPSAPVTRNPRQIFISHAHQDAAVAQRLAHDLAAHGYDIWIAPDSIRPGEKWVEAINRGLEESGIFVLLLSPDAVASRWVQIETNVAISLNREDEMQVYPLLLTPCRLPVLWRAFQYISFIGSYEPAFVSLREDLDQNVSGSVSVYDLNIVEHEVDPEADILEETYSSEVELFPVNTGDDVNAAEVVVPESGAFGIPSMQEDPEAWLERLLRDDVVDAEKMEATDKESSSVKMGDHANVAEVVEPGSGTFIHSIEEDPEAWLEQLLSEGVIGVDEDSPQVQVEQSTLSTKTGMWLHSKSGKEMVQVPAGEFLYGLDKKKIYLDEFWIAKTPVTNAEYAHFVAATRYQPPKHWEGRVPPREILDHPVVCVSWYDARTYAEWIGMELPTEQEWEKAARENDGKQYPWGDAWRDNHCNTSEKGIGKTSPVGQFSPAGDSKFGCIDMAGNVWEWTTDPVYHEGYDCHMVRGGSWGNNATFARVTNRFYVSSVKRNNDLGFRVVVRHRQSY